MALAWRLKSRTMALAPAMVDIGLSDKLAFAGRKLLDIFVVSSRIRSFQALNTYIINLDNGTRF